MFYSMSQHVASWKPWGRSAFDPSPVAVPAQERGTHSKFAKHSEKRVASTTATTRGHVIFLSSCHECIVDIRYRYHQCRVQDLKDTSRYKHFDHQRPSSRTSEIFLPSTIACIRTSSQTWTAFLLMMCLFMFYMFGKVLLGVAPVLCSSWFMIHFFVLIHVQLFVEGVRMEVKIGRDGVHTLRAETGTLTFDIT